MATFASLGDSAPSAPMLLLLGILGVTSHLALLPVVTVTATVPWTRACGYAWIAIDVMLNVASINGMSINAVTPLRLGGHVLAAVWIADAALSADGAPRFVGFVLAGLLAGHAMTATWIPAWVLFIPFALVPVWLAILGRHLQQSQRPA